MSVAYLDATLDFETFWRRQEYSATLPTGKWSGKTWRCAVARDVCPSGWLLAMYGEEFTHPTDGEVIAIYWFRVTFDGYPPGFGCRHHTRYNLWEVWCDAFNGTVMAKDLHAAVSVLREKRR